ncbi:autotransporter domain-containing protein [Akkermansia sp. BIOML-A52]|nr:autotransporter domain-containing protein [Akkermansia sp. BIOML-A52]KAA3204107.1 autotransporter domain-containing protein [Akkermansia sp. BIOML-A47]KAA3234277.1 autotransporter domain-containing protein [Akkermansia sp. BIOML-A32]KAA3239966.1 autotransporter domain-containing protein [Akkermansia sp. BIOML-A33]KAA3243964.1 autotransporter domain-containing protein [Akkermansia sp. BIOML-A31]KAA3272145.1 autotransporter domain-containing protein [Akkermansia sp. BIOML-A20]KAA3274623.1 au
MKIYLPLTLRTTLLSALILANPFPKAEAGYLNGLDMETDVWTDLIRENAILDSWYRIDISNSSSAAVDTNYLTISNSGEIIFNSTGCYIGEEIIFTNNHGNITFSNSSIGLSLKIPVGGHEGGGINFTNNQSDITFSGNSRGAISLYNSLYADSGDLNFTETLGDISFLSNSSASSQTAPDSDNYGAGGAIDSKRGNINFTKNHGNITFSANSVTQGATYNFSGGAIRTISGNISFTKNQGNIIFSENSVCGGEFNGIITTQFGAVSFTDNSGSIIFKNNKGRAIYSYSGESISFARNQRDIIFSGNTGTAICSSCGITTFTGNLGDITFSDNSAASGGAIDGNTTFTGNLGDITFSGNSAASGGVITGNTTFTENQRNISFSGNSATSGGAIDGNTTFTENQGDITFSDNSAASGVITGDTTFITNNKGDVTFSGNSAISGGAINFSQKLSIANNKSVIFQGNSAKDLGGAIYSHNRSYLSIVNNETVEFRRNYVKQYDKEGILTGAVLNSIALEDSGTRTLELSTGADGGTITFYDPVKASNTMFSLNLYEDSEGNSVTGNGAIVFSGLHAEDDLKQIFQTLGLDTTGEAFRSSLTESLSSSITYGSTVILHGGSLNVADRAILNILKKKNFNSNYLAKADSTTELSNNGVLNIEGSATFECDGNSYAYLNITGGSTMKTSGDFTSSGYTKLHEGTLDIGGNTVVKDGGRIEFQSGSSFTAGGKYTVRESSAVEFTGSGTALTAQQIVFEQGSYLNHYRGTGSTLKAQSVTMTGAELRLRPQNDGYALTVDANLDLTDSTIWLSPENSGSIPSYGTNGIDVTGILSVSGSTTINLNSEYASLNDEKNAGLTLFRLNGETAGSNFTGNISDWTLQSWTETYDAGTQTWINTFNPLENAELATTILSGGKWGVILKLEEGSTPTPGEDDIYVDTGEEKSITDLGKRVYLQGGTLDATGIPQNTPLTNQIIVEGTDGLLVMNEDQSLILTGNLTGKKGIGYDIDGTAGNSSGGVAIGSSNGSLNSSAVDLSGERYNIASLNVRSGLADIKETASLGHENTVITVGSSRNSGETNASLINNGAIQGSSLTVNSDGSVTNNKALNVANINLNSQSALANTGDLTAEQITVAKDALLNNSGSLEGNVTLQGWMSNSGQTTGMVLVQNGGILSGGGSFESVTVRQGGRLNIQGAANFNGLTFEEGSGMAFSVNGTRPFSTGMNATDTYFHATVGTLSLAGTPSIEVHVGSGLIAAGSEFFTLNLLQATEITGDAALEQQLHLTGETGLLENGGVLAWNPETGLLTFSGKLNIAAASGLAGHDAALLADTLWSSVSSVASFARTASAQGKMAGNRSSRLWGAGLGYFTSMSSMDSLSGFSYQGGGYAVGTDVALGKDAVAGAAFGQMFGTHKSSDSMLSDKQRSFMFALYGNVRKELARGHELNLSGYFSYGSIDHAARTHVGGSRQTPGRARWDDNVYAFGLLADWDIKISNTFTVSPYTGITYMYGTQGPIEETFDGGSRSFGNGGLQSWSIPVGVSLKSVCGLGNGQALLPELSVAYVGDIARRNPYTRTWTAGQSVTGRGHTPGRHALMTRAGLDWQINRNWQAGAYYTLEVRSGQTNQSVNLNASYSF